MADKKTEERALRTIVVSGRAALKKTTGPDQAERIKHRVHELLADLEETVIRDGADEDMLTTIERKRRELWE